jgi:hypothetical protein
METLEGFPNLPATLRWRRSRQAPHAWLKRDSKQGVAKPRRPSRARNLLSVDEHLGFAQEQHGAAGRLECDMG